MRAPKSRPGNDRSRAGSGAKQTGEMALALFDMQSANVGGGDWLQDDSIFRLPPDPTLWHSETVFQQWISTESPLLAHELMRRIIPSLVAAVVEEFRTHSYKRISLAVIEAVKRETRAGRSHSLFGLQKWIYLAVCRELAPPEKSNNGAPTCNKEQPVTQAPHESNRELNIDSSPDDEIFERWKLLRDDSSLEEFKRRTRSAIEADLAAAIGRLTRKELLSAIDFAYASMTSLPASKLQEMDATDAKQWLSECAVDSIDARARS